MSVELEAIWYYDNVIVYYGTVHVSIAQLYSSTKLKSLFTAYSFVRGYHAWHHGVVGA